MEISMQKWLDSEAYQNQKAVINREVNVNQQYKPGYARPRFATAGEIDPVDRSCFKKTITERVLISTLKEHVENKGKLKTIFKGIF